MTQGNGLLEDMTSTLAGIRKDTPVTPLETDRIQVAFYKVQKTKQATRDPEILAKLAQIASRFDKVSYTPANLSNKAAKNSIANCVEFIHAKMFGNR